MRGTQFDRKWEQSKRRNIQDVAHGHAQVSALGTVVVTVLTALICLIAIGVVWGLLGAPMETYLLFVAGVMTGVFVTLARDLYKRTRP